MTSRRPFLTGEWRYLAMLNWRVAPSLLEPLVPRGTALDRWNGATYVSIVGFLFRDTRLLGVPVPLHRDFEEVNLRFYVRREVGGEPRRAVTFVKELVPRRAIAAVARLAYNEPYVALPMRHRIGRPAERDAERHSGRHAEHAAAPDAAPGVVEYAWRLRDRWSRLAVVSAGVATAIAPGSEAEFITEHYWGYTRQRDGGTVEYQVEHPRWRTWAVSSATLEADVARLYGPAFADVLAAPPDSAFLAEGSAIAVHRPTRIET